MFHDLVGTVPGVLVLVCFQALWDRKAGSEARARVASAAFRGGGRELGVCHEELISLHWCRISDPTGMCPPPCKHSPWLRSNPRHLPNQTLQASCACPRDCMKQVPGTGCPQPAPRHWVSHTRPWHCTCILVFTTSRGVLPKTLAAPARAPNTPVMKGFMGLLGLSPGKEERLRAEWWWDSHVHSQGSLQGRSQVWLLVFRVQC